MEKYSEIQWLYFLIFIGKDSRLNVWHLALLSALVQLAYIQKEGKIIHVSRSKLMEKSHISTIPTYHKYFKQIQDMGYIRYTPSYHPGYRSTVELLIFSDFQIIHCKQPKGL
ncbi:hypothetical protein [Elizabethkingia anophelis]|uniref:Uncharacterized protein n=1 Tax=Elizabethkingia anophelis TaxID=1117645 RepID=A0AAU8UVS8_9FLAO|nr:hypothetical protein [Elizabethkingia anophelis]AQX02336.1 hypothetical protein BBD32_13140 [Elizabethkingia anophelis]OPB61267.1 hypothetical protein BAY11_05935 [Elizabethkingia anophelis]